MILLPLCQAIIDLLIPGQTPGIKERLVDLYSKPELLFFGPDGKKLVCPISGVHLLNSVQNVVRGYR